MRTDDDRSLDELLPPQGEHPMTAREVAALTGRPIASVYHWMNQNRLESWTLIGGRRVTTREAVERALRRESPLPPRESRLRREASREARSRANRAELKRLGVL